MTAKRLLDMIHTEALEAGEVIRLETKQAMTKAPSIEQQIAELKDAGWIPVTKRCWKAPAGSGCGGYFLGPHGAWKAMKSRQARTKP